MRYFSNWAGNHRCQPEQIHQPADEAELIALVRDARASSRTIRVVGAAHSWSDIAMSDSVLVSLDRMASVRAFDADRNQIRVQAGMRLRDLNRELAQRGRAMSVLGSVVAQSIAGAIATGTHGSSRVHGNLASFVVGLRLVTGQGELLELAEGDERLDALRVGLGVAGIVSEVSLRVEPAFQLLERKFPLPFAEALARLQELVDSFEYVKFWWLPHTDLVEVFCYERSTAPSNLSRFALWLDEHVLNRYVFPVVLWLGGRTPRWIPAINRLISRLVFVEEQRVGPSDAMFTLAMPPRHLETEWAMPRAAAVEALRGLRSLVRSQRLKVNFIQELRFVRADDGWMSPAYGRETCQMGAYCASSPSLPAYLAGAQALFRQLGGRPHWGKLLETSPAEIARLLPRCADFLRLVRELDPQGIFSNSFTRRVLGI